MLGEQCDGLARLASTAGTSNTVDVVFDGEGELGHVSKRQVLLSG